MNRDEKQAALKSFHLFSDLTDNELDALTDSFEVENFPENTVVIHQGSQGDKIYFIFDGTVHAYILNKEGKDILIGTLTKNEYFGELAILSHNLRACSIKTVSSCTMLSLSSELFNSLAQENLSICKKLNHILCDRLSNTIDIVSERRKNTIILMLGNSEAEKRIQYFKNYFKSISPKKVIFLEHPTQSELTNINCELEDTFICISSLISNKAPQIQLPYFIINFVEKNNEHIFLTSDVSTWKIEHTARVIAKKTVGIALCSGGLPAYAHISILQTLDAAGVPFDYLVGTSSGASIAAYYAFGLPIEEAVYVPKTEGNLKKLSVSLRHLSFNLSGIISNNYFRKMYQPIFGNQQVEDANIPYAAVASNLMTGKTVVIKTGNLIEAILASNAASVIIEPVLLNGQLLTDGIATAPLPVEVLIAEKIDIKIAVPIPQLDLTVTIGNNPKMPSIYVRSRAMMAEQMVNLSTLLADVIIRPEVKGIKLTDYHYLDRVLKEGEKAAILAVKRIRYLLYGELDK